MTEQTPTPDPWKDVEMCVLNPFIDAEEAWRIVDAARAHDQQRIADLSAAHAAFTAAATVRVETAEAQIARLSAQNERLTLQARDISLMLSESGCGAMPIVEGVRWLIGYDHKLRAALSTAEATIQSRARELADLEATIDRADAHTAGLLAQLDAAEATIASFTAELKTERLEVIGAIARKEKAQHEADTLRAERDAAQQERDSIAKQLHAEVMSERERRVAAQEGITLKYVPELEAAQQENQTLREALKAAWCELIQHDDQPWVKTLAGQVRVVGLFAFPRPQESQP